jgi:hypothetical protein
VSDDMEGQDRHTDHNEIRSALPLDFLVFCQHIQVLTSDLDWLFDGKALDTITKVDLRLCRIALLCSGLGNWGGSWMAKSVSAFNSADL